MKFHFNEVALRHTAQSRLPDREGRLLYRSSKGAYKERWFRLHGNLLFYFRTNEFGAISDHDPLGVFVLAKFSVELEQFADRPFVFTIAFYGEEGKKHYFSGQTMQQCIDWMDALQRNSYEALRIKFESLRTKIQRLTGKDPIKEKMAISFKKKVRSNIGTLPGNFQESRQTKFYYDDGLNSVKDVLAGSVASTGKPPQSSELSKPKLQDKMHLGSVASSLEALSLQNNPLTEEPLVLLTPEESFVQQSLAVTSNTPVSVLQSRGTEVPVIQSVTTIPFALAAAGNLQPSIMETPVRQPIGVQIPPPEPSNTSLPVVPQSMAHFSVTQPGITRTPFVYPRISQVLQSIVQVPAMPPVMAQRMPSGISQVPLVSCSMVPPMQTGAVQIPMTQPGFLPFTQQQSAQKNLLLQNSGKDTSIPSGFVKQIQKEEGSSLQSLSLCVSEPNPAGSCRLPQAALGSNKSQTMPELTSIHKWETFDD